MKLIHTSDWHLGHILYGYDRTTEQLFMLRQIENIVKEQQPDLLIISGDVYHNPQPPAAVQTMFSDAIVRIHTACPEMVMVVTAGNHDSSNRHEIFKTPWQTLNVYAIGLLDKENIDRHIIELPGKGFVAAFPYAHERNIPEGFFQSVLDQIQQRNVDNLPVIMTAHTTVSGCDFSGHDNASEHTVGGIDAFNLSEMGSGYDYLALGHIHCPQWLHGSDHRARYCGTPLPINFSETQNHSVTLIELAHHGDELRAETIPIENPLPLISLPEAGFTNWDSACQLLREFPDDVPAYIRLNVEFEDYPPTSAQAEAFAIAKDKAAKFCIINFSRKNSNEGNEEQLAAFTIQEFQEEAPIDIALRYVAARDLPFNEELQQMFREAVKAVDEESRNNN